MPIEWNTIKIIKLRNTLLSLVNGKRMNLEDIAKEINEVLNNEHDKYILKHKMQELRNSDKDLEFFGYLKGKYLIAETESERRQISMRFANTSITYRKKADHWLLAAKHAKKDECEQLSFLQEGN